MLPPHDAATLLLRRYHCNVPALMKQRGLLTMACYVHVQVIFITPMQHPSKHLHRLPQHFGTRFVIATIYYSLHPVMARNVKSWLSIPNT